MLKDRLYYKDSYLKTFKSTVVKTDTDSDGNPFVVLENTAFYPTGGGQPHDLGTLNNISVVNVEEFDGEIRHMLEEVLTGTSEVEGVIDWAHRFDHMQQHAGQHILTAAFVELFEFPTVSFHLGKEIVSIDIDSEKITQKQLDEVESLANKIIIENRPIETKWVTEDELDQQALRKQLTVSDEIRLVIIPEFDYNGCGGTHPESTGQVCALKILSVEKQKKMTRVHFVCGGRVLQQLQKKNSELSLSSKLLSVPEAGTAKAIEKLLEMNHTLDKSLKDANESLLSFEAKQLMNQQQNGIVTAVFKKRTVQELQKLARLPIAEDDKLIVLLVAENVDKLQFVAARGATIAGSMKNIASGVLPLINGKGGGSDVFVQGGGELTFSGEELLQKMKDLVDSL